ncbi:MAG: alanine dehydrogenase [Flavobacteriales bacterium]
MKAKIDISTLFVPQEEKLAISNSQQQLCIGIPKECSVSENRLGLNPDGVDFLVKQGHVVMVETGAGLRSQYSDADFSEVGARIVYNPKDIFACPIVLKINAPTPIELSWMKGRQVLISAIQPHKVDRGYFQILAKKYITAIGFEILKDNSGSFSVVRSMSEIAGSSVMQIASHYLSNSSGGIGRLLGGIPGIPPAEVVILGSGTVAEYATRTALGLGASVKVFDTKLDRLRRFQSLFTERVYTSLAKPKIIEQALLNADVSIGAMRAHTKRTPMLVNSDLVSRMKTGSIIIDVSIDRGGCFETSELTTIEDPVFTKFGVIHYGVPNIGSTVSRTATYALSNIFSSLLLSISERGGVAHLLAEDEYFRNSIYSYQGKSTNKLISDLFDLPYTNLNLFFHNY